MQQTTECSHDLCNCELTAEMLTEAYCSDYCRNVQEGGIEMEVCGCGHPQCDVQ